jgi:uncharacterized protein
MITEDNIRNIIKGQQEILIKKYPIKREISLPSNIQRIIIVTGIRRCGKSTLLHQLFSNATETLSINFEDPRLEGFELADFNKIEHIALKENKQVLLFDEVQNIPEWEKFARAAHEKGIKLCITGSNASMLSKELGTRLTGRYIQIELFPFSYNEFLIFTNQQSNIESFNKYLNNGGFPDYLVEQNQEYLRTLLRDIIMRDIAVRRDIRNEHFIIRLAIHILSNIGKEFSYNNITRTLDIKSVRTTIDYCDFLQESYLIELIPRYSLSIRQQLANPKKAYCIDTAMAKANSLSFSEDLGRMLENAAYLHLRRNTKELSYFKNEKGECDFLVKKNGAIVKAVQVCLHINDNNIKRELTGIQQAMKEAGCPKGIIVTLDQEDELDGIPLIPAWKWMKEPINL